MADDSNNERKRESVAILGGSFDPVHQGHLGMAATVIEHTGVDRIIFVPCFVSPFKSGTVASPEQRADMLELAINDSGWDWASVSRFEIERPEPSYSWETAEHFTRAMPEADLHWIVGTDQWEQLERWAEPEKLRTLLKFIVLTRGKAEVKARSGWRHETLPFEHAASSTKIREQCAEHVEWLTLSVLDYCREHSLYGAAPQG
jgi:nicotinate-nucleotide adenylyltransferase